MRGGEAYALFGVILDDLLFGEESELDFWEQLGVYPLDQLLNSQLVPKHIRIHLHLIATITSLDTIAAITPLPSHHKSITITTNPLRRLRNLDQMLYDIPIIQPRQPSHNIHCSEHCLHLRFSIDLFLHELDLVLLTGPVQYGSEEDDGVVLDVELLGVLVSSWLGDVVVLYCLELLS